MKKQFETVTEQTITMADGSQVTYYPSEIALGYNGTKFAYGLGVHPNALGTADRYITYDVSTKTRSGDVTTRYSTNGFGPTVTGSLTSMSGDITIR